MNVLEFSGLLFGTSLLAGFLGALTGLGGGVVIVPVLAIFFKMDIRYAIGASLVSVIATSSGAAVAYVREGLSNIRIWDVSGGCPDFGGLLWSVPCDPSFHALDRYRLWPGTPLLGDSFIPPERPGRTRGGKSSQCLRDKARIERSLPWPAGWRDLYSAACPARLWHHVRRGHSFRTAWHRLGRSKSACNGPGDETGRRIFGFVDSV